MPQGSTLAFDIRQVTCDHPVNRSRICVIYVVLKLGAILTSLRPNFYGRVPHDNVTQLKSTNDAVLNFQKRKCGTLPWKSTSFVHHILLNIYVDRVF